MMMMIMMMMMTTLPIFLGLFFTTLAVSLDGWLIADNALERIWKAQFMA
jgi:hypothetical protein